MGDISVPLSLLGTQPFYMYDFFLFLNFRFSKMKTSKLVEKQCETKTILALCSESSIN